MPRRACDVQDAARTTLEEKERMGKGERLILRYDKKKSRMSNAALRAIFRPEPLRHIWQLFGESSQCRT